MGRRACLSIGVGTVTPVSNEELRFGHLDGAALAARAIGNWALQSGFGADNVRVVDDGPQAAPGKADPVTCARVQQAVDELFPAGAEVVEHLILAFCGHGLTDANMWSISWLFSDSLFGKYRVVAERFCEELQLHGVEHITLINDSCREAPKNLDLLRLGALAGITVHGVRPKSPKLDRLAACQDGKLGYMVAEPMSALPGKCVFSGVIADVLWGLEPGAIMNGLITTATLGACARVRANERAREYNLEMYPQCLVDPEPAVLREMAKPLPGPIELQPWPPAAKPPVSMAAPKPMALNASELIVQRARTDSGFRNELLTSGFELKLHKLVAPIIAVPRNSENLLQDFVVPAQPATYAPMKRRKVKALRQRLEFEFDFDDRVDTDLHVSAAGEVRERLAGIGEPGEANLIVAGVSSKLFSRYSVGRLESDSTLVKLRVEGDAQGTPVLVEFANALFTPVVPYENLYTVVTQSASGDVFQACGETSGSRTSYLEAIGAIEDFAAGRLGAENIDELARHLRRDKHTDPVLGAICAYLYRCFGDYDSIRRMAYFYCSHGQPVPFDIALLGIMPVTRRADGALELHVPAVKAHDKQPDLPDYITQATPPVQALVGGRCPWLGLGWDYVNAPGSEWAVLVEGLADQAGSVRRSGFTSLPKQSAHKLAAIWGLRAR